MWCGFCILYLSCFVLQIMILPHAGKCRCLEDNSTGSFENRWHHRQNRLAVFCLKEALEGDFIVILAQKRKLSHEHE